MANFQLVVPTRFCQAGIGTANTILYTVPAKMVAYLKDIDIPNMTGAAIAVTVYTGNGTASANILIPAVSIPANSIFQWTGTQILNAGDTIVAAGSAIGCNAICSGGQAI